LPADGLVRRRASLWSAGKARSSNSGVWQTVGDELIDCRSTSIPDCLALFS
jgi:hypothetical protein